MRYSPADGPIDLCPGCSQTTAPEEVVPVCSIRGRTEAAQARPPAVWVVVLIVIVAAGWFWSARQWLERGVRSAAALSRCDRGVQLTAQGKLTAAIEQFREAIRINSGCAEAYSGLGFVLLLQDKVEEAVDASRKAIQLKPTLPMLT